MRMPSARCTTTPGSNLLAGLLLSTLFCVMPVCADTIVLTLDESTVPANLACGGTWNEAGLDLTVLPTDPEICGLELCNFSRLTDRFGLGASFLKVDLTSISGTVVSASLTITTVCNCFRAVLYDGTTIVDSDTTGFGNPQTLMVFTSGMPVDRLVFEPCVDTSVLEIHIEFDPTPSSVGPTDALNLQFQAQPNPFKAATRISFSLQPGARPPILIYDVTGRVVRSLVDSELASGRWTATWDGRDVTGHRLPAGVYLAGVAVNGRATPVGKVVIAR